MAGPSENECVEFPETAPNLAQIEKSPEHKLTLKEWRREYQFLMRDYERKLAWFQRSRSDLIKILSLNFVFQGVLVSGIAPSTVVVCRQLPYVIVLSIVASVGTFFATVLKMKDIAVREKRVDIQKRQMQWQNARICDLKDQGTNYDFTRIPILNTDTIQTVALGFVKVWVCSSTGVILIAVFVFSVLIIISLEQMLCE